MKPLKKILKIVIIGYGLVTALTATGLLAYAGLEKLSGKEFNPWAHAVAEALFEGDSADNVAADEAPRPKATETVTTKTIEDGLVLDELRREILQAADEIQLLESSVVDQISRDLSDMDKRREAQASRVLKPFADLLNLVLVGDEEWDKVTGNQTLDAQKLRSLLQTGRFRGADGNWHSFDVAKIKSKIIATQSEVAAYQRIETSFNDEMRKLDLVKGLSVNDIASGLSHKQSEIADEQAVRLLMSLDPKKSQDVFKAITEANGQRAATLLQQLLAAQGATVEGIPPAPRGGVLDGGTQ